MKPRINFGALAKSLQSDVAESEPEPCVFGEGVHPGQQRIPLDAKGISWDRWYMGNRAPENVWQNGAPVPNPKYDGGEVARVMRRARIAVERQAAQSQAPIPVPDANTGKRKPAQSQDGKMLRTGTTNQEAFD